MQTSRTQKKTLLIGGAVLVLAALLALCLLGGCTQQPGQDGTDAGGTQAGGLSYTFTDDLGYEVEVTSVDRVVACMGSFANTWELAGGTLVGVTQDALQDYTLNSPDVATVGDFTAPNLEAIIALQPDFVIMTGAATGKDGAANQVDLREGLQASGIQVAYFNVTTFDDYLRMLRTCCDITGREDLYVQNGASVEAAITALKAKVPAGEAPTVLLMTTYSGGTRVQNSSTMTGTMLSELGAKNLADEYPSLLKDFSLESVIDLNPDFILVVPMGNDSAAAMKNLEDATADNPAWATLDAVKDNRYITLDPKLFQYKPNAGWATSYQTLFDILYS